MLDQSLVLEESSARLHIDNINHVVLGVLTIENRVTLISQFGKDGVRLNKNTRKGFLLKTSST